jgi:hypothetical protein
VQRAEDIDVSAHGVEGLAIEFQDGHSRRKWLVFPKPHCKPRMLGRR